MPRHKPTTLHAATFVRGDVFLRVRDAVTNEVLRRIQIRNKILNGGFAALVALLDTGSAPQTVSRLRIGTGTTPPAATNVDVAISIAVAVSTPYPFGKVDFLATKTESVPTNGPYELIINATAPGGISADPFNGVTLTEAALILTGGNAFARQVHPAITKTPAIAIDYEWHISFVPAP